MSESDTEPQSLAVELRDAHVKLMMSRVKMSPVTALRSSSIGNECARFLVYEQVAHEMRLAHGPELQALFDLGNEMERYCVRLLEDMGYVIEQRNRSFHNRQHNITGHLDGRITKRGWKKTYPIEIKGLNPFTADTVSSLADIRNSRQPWVRKYYSQLQIYEFLDQDKLGLFVLLNKSSGRPEFIEAPYDEEHVAKLLAKANLVKEAVLSGQLPERHRTSDCPRCPFVHVCLPDIEFGKGMQPLDTPELIEAIRKRDENREAHKRYEAADRMIKSLMPKEAGELLIGPYSASGKKIDRVAFSVDAGSYVKWDIRQVAKELPAEPILDPFTGPRYALPDKQPQISISLEQPKPVATEDDDSEF